MGRGGCNFRIKRSGHWCYWAATVSETAFWTFLKQCGIRLIFTQMPDAFECWSKWCWRCWTRWRMHCIDAARTPPGNAQHSFQMALCSSSRPRTESCRSRTRKTAVLCTFSVQQFLEWGNVWRNGTLRWHIKLLAVRHCDLYRAVAAGFLTNWILAKN